MNRGRSLDRRIDGSYNDSVSCPRDGWGVRKGVRSAGQNRLPKSNGTIGIPEAGKLAVRNTDKTS